MIYRAFGTYHERYYTLENLIELEEHLQLLMYQVFSEILGDIFTQLDQVIVKTKQQENWVVKRKDSKTIQFIFGAVTFQHTLMGDKKGQSHYALDEWIRSTPVQ